MKQIIKFIFIFYFSLFGIVFSQNDGKFNKRGPFKQKLGGGFKTEYNIELENGLTMIGKNNIVDVVFESEPGAVAHLLGLSSNGLSQIQFTSNVTWDGDSWDLDNTSGTGWIFTLDSNTGSDFVRLRHAPQGANPATLTEFFRVNSDGDFGIGTSTFTSRLGVNGGNVTIDVDGTYSDGDHHLEIQNGASFSEIDAGEGSFTTTSARWLKENIKPLFRGKTPSFQGLSTQTYNYIGLENRLSGLMSDEWNALMGRPDNGKISYHEVIVVMVAKIKELEKKIEKFEKK